MNEAAPIEPRDGAHGLWETALAQLQLQVTRPNFDTWLKDTVGMQFDDGLFVVGAPNDFATAWLTTKLRPLVAKTLSGIVGHPVDVSFAYSTAGRMAAPPPSRCSHPKPCPARRPSGPCPSRG